MFASGIELSLSVLQSCKLTGLLFESHDFLFRVEATTSLTFSFQDLIVTSYHKDVSTGSKYTRCVGEHQLQHFVQPLLFKYIIEQ